jgi:glycosyltransferase involved in cell wall biosynthesis
MIRVLHVVTRMDVGGSTDDLTLLLTRLPAEEFASRLLSGPTLDPPAGFAETLSRAGVHWGQVRHLVRPVSPLADGRALRALRRAIRESRPDIVHTHTSKAGFLGRLAARWAGAPRILHTPHGHVFHGYFGTAATSAFVVLERWAARFTERIITLTDAEAAQHLAAGIGRPGQFVTIPSGVDLAALHAAAGSGPRFRDAIGAPAAAPLLGAVSRLVPIKGLHHLLAAMPEILRRLPAARLVIAGDGEERAALEAQAAAVGMIPRVHFLGFRTDVAAILSALDVFVLPSLNEGLGKALVEAMALGVPVVATRVGGVPEVVEDGRQGILVPPADPAALAKAIVALLEDPARAASMGAAGRARAPHFSAEVMLARHAALYRNIR